MISRLGQHTTLRVGRSRTQSSRAVASSRSGGDWEAHIQFFRLRSVNSDNFCWLCDTTSITPGPLHYHNFAVHAPHRATMFSHLEYMMSCAREGSQPAYLFRCPGFLLEYLVVDSMHAADLGCFADALGSLFWLEMASHQFYPNQAKGLEGLNRQLNAFYRVNKHLAAVTPLVHSQIVATKPGYPFLKAKAAQCRHLAEFAVILAAKHAFGAPASDGQPARAPFCFPANHRLHGREREHLDLLFAMAQSMAAYSRAVSAPQFDANACCQSMLSFFAGSVLLACPLARRSSGRFEVA